MKKRSLSIALILALVLSLLPITAFAEGTESIPLPLDEDLMDAIENAEPSVDHEMISQLAAQHETAMSNRTLPHRATRSVYSPYYCNLIYIAQNIVSKGVYVSSSNLYGLSTTLEHEDSTIFASIIYDPSDYELLFAISCDSDTLTVYAFVTYDLLTGRMIDDAASFSINDGRYDYTGYAYLTPETYSEYTSLTIYTTAPSTVAQEIVNLWGATLRLGLACWDNILLSNTLIGMGDIGYTLFCTTTGYLVPVHDFQITSSYNGETVYTCSYCGKQTTVYDLCDGGVACPSYKFTDVNAGNWFHGAVDFAVSHNLFNGISATTFEPNAPMTRAMLVTVLWRYEGSPNVGANIFNDVPNGAWYTNAVAWASANGIVSGIGGGKFDPDGKITREQMATILFRYAEKKGIDTSKRGDLSAFPDANKISAYAKEAIAWAVGEGLINGSDGKLLPQGNATRAQVATILMRFIEKIS